MLKKTPKQTNVSNTAKKLCKPLKKSKKIQFLLEFKRKKLSKVTKTQKISPKTSEKPS